MVERNLADSRSLAQRLVMAGQVRVDGELALKPSMSAPEDALITIDQGPPFVSRGGEKLQAALQSFPITISGRICADVGASTGGFTDCLLQNGAVRVYAIDVGKGILHWKLRQDGRVIVMEGINARHIERLPEPVSLVTIDASFISLKILLPVVRGWLLQPPDPASRTDLKSETHQDNDPGDVIALIKPQFEAGRSLAARGDGVIRDPQIHHNVLTDILHFALNAGFQVNGLLRSPLLGPKGNTEFLAWLKPHPIEEGKNHPDQISELIAALFN